MSESGACPKTPYNSIYANMEKRKKEKKESIVCCEHGKPCARGEKNTKKEDTSSYVNLMKEGAQDKNRDEVAEQRTDKIMKLAMRLREVEMKSAKRQKREQRKKKNMEEKSEKSKKKSKKQREMVKMEKILNDAAELTFIDESEGTKVGDNMSKQEQGELSKAMSFLKTSGESSNKKKNNKKRDTRDETAGRVRSISESKNRRQKKNKTEEHSGLRKAKYAEECGANRCMYLGIVSKLAAEESLEKPADFRIYHQADNYNDLNNLPASIKLYLVSNNDEGFRHDPIRQAMSPSGKTKLYMDISGQTMMFKRLDELVSYYETNKS